MLLKIPLKHIFYFMAARKEHLEIILTWKMSYPNVLRYAKNYG